MTAVRQEQWEGQIPTPPPITPLSPLSYNIDELKIPTERIMKAKIKDKYYALIE